MRKAEKQNEYFLTESPILSALVKLALPITASSFFSTAYNLTDMMWIGRLGSVAVAAVGAGSMFLWFTNAFAVLSRMGGQVYAAQCLGRREIGRAKEYAWGALLLAAVLGLGAGGICVLFSENLIRLLQIRETRTILLGKQYLQITAGFMVFHFLNQVLTGLYTAKGNSRLPLLANMSGLVTNMVLDPLLILGPGPFPRMEVTGAAVATVTAQCISLLVFITHMVLSSSSDDKIQTQTDLQKELSDDSHKEQRRASDPIDYWPPVRVSKRTLKDILKMGIPNALQSSAFCFFSMVLTSFSAGYGSGAVAVQRLGAQIESVTWNTADGFGSALNAFVGQNYGAGKMDRIRKGFLTALLITVSWGAFFTILFLIFPKQIASVFFFEPEVVALFVSYLVIVGLSEPFMSAEITSGAALCGMGKTMIFSLTSILLTGSRIPLAWFLTRTGMGLNGVWWALTSTSIAKGIVLSIVFWIVCRSVGRHSSQPSVSR